MKAAVPNPNNRHFPFEGPHMEPEGSQGPAFPILGRIWMDAQYGVSKEMFKKCSAPPCKRCAVHVIY